MSNGASLRLKLKKKAKLVVRNSRNNRRTRNDEDSFEGENGNDGSYVKLNTRVKLKGLQTGEGGGSERGEFGDERGEFRTLDSFGRKKRVYAKDMEGMAQNNKVENGKVVSNKKALLKKGDKKEKDEIVELKIKKKALLKRGEKKVNDGFIERKTSQRKMWVSRKSREASSEAKHSIREMKDKKENVVLRTAKVKPNAQNDDAGGGLMKKNRENKSEFSIGQSQTVVYASSFGKRKDRDKVRLNDNIETHDDKPKKKKRVIKIDPHDISNKRLDDGSGIDGSKEENEKECGKEPQLSLNAQFRAIQPSSPILSFVENNLLGRRRVINLKRAGYNIDLPVPLDNIPFSSSSERERIEETVFRNKLEFFAAAKVSSSFPPRTLPEIAFAGRSNVGKSSLLNALTRQWGVVRTSDKPGLTQTINFFKLGTKLCLVDLPGYGFAYAKEDVKEAWEELVKEYVATRVGLKRVCLLIDTKWGMKARDYELIELMERSKTKYQIVLTKTDTVFPIDVARRAMQIEESLLQNKSLVQPLMMVSSKSGAGIRSLRTVLATIARLVKI